MSAVGLAMFGTHIGKCGIAWSERGIVGVHLPSGDVEATRAHLERRFPQARMMDAPVTVLIAMGAIVSLLRGERVDLSSIVVDMTGLATFERAVYEAARRIPHGETRTYGEIAADIGQPAAARDVGVALARNPFAIVVPCHRVVAANGKPGGFSAPGGVLRKLQLLTIEGGFGPLFAQPAR